MRSETIKITESLDQIDPDEWNQLVPVNSPTLSFQLLNALENVIIPQYKQRVRFILATLEEREREEFARLKKVKASMEKRQ